MDIEESKVSNETDTKPNQSDQKIKMRNNIIKILSAIGLLACITVLFPQVRQIMFDYIAKNVIYKEAAVNPVWDGAFIKFAILGIFFILLFDYCTLIHSGKLMTQKIKNEITDCLAEIDFRSFRKPSLILFGLYLL